MPTASSCDGLGSARSTSPTPTPNGSCRSTTRSPSCPPIELDGEAARRAAHGVVVEGTAEGAVRLRDAAGLIAIAEPRSGSQLKPVVGFRG